MRTGPGESGANSNELQMAQASACKKGSWDGLSSFRDGRLGVANHRMLEIRQESAGSIDSIFLRCELEYLQSRQDAVLSINSRHGSEAKSNTATSPSDNNRGSDPYSTSYH
jgi:hypothetical protein